MKECLSGGIILYLFLLTCPKPWVNLPLFVLLVFREGLASAPYYTFNHDVHVIDHFVQ